LHSLSRKKNPVYLIKSQIQGGGEEDVLYIPLIG